jgi:hypothetical protein
MQNRGKIIPYSAGIVFLCEQVGNITILSSISFIIGMRPRIRRKKIANGI